MLADLSNNNLGQLFQSGENALQVVPNRMHLDARKKYDAIGKGH